MSIVIKMNMPKSCKECPMTYTDTGDDAYFSTHTKKCVFDNAEISLEGRYDDCPILCELSENHGRLIDADALDKLCDSSEYHEVISGWIDLAPTIIEAEGRRYEYLDSNSFLYN